MEQDKFLQAFALLDHDHNQSLIEAEIDQAVIDTSLDTDLAEIVAVLKADFKEITHLHKEGWFARRDAITLSDILVFEHILHEHTKDLDGSQSDIMLAIQEEKHKTTDPKMLAEIASQIMERVRTIANVNHSLYGYSEDPLKSIKPEAIRQGMVGDCFFLAALASVAATNPQIIPRMIKTNEDSTYTITFPGLRNQPIKVAPPTVIELALYARLSACGIWPALLEKAYGTYQAEFMKHPSLVAAENTAGAEHMSEAFQLLTGQNGKSLFLHNISHSHLSNILTKAFREKRAVGASTYHNKHRTYTTDAGLPTNHAYSVIDWNEDFSRITLRNPWGSIKQREPELVGGKASDGSCDGIFTLDLLHFLLNFDFLYYEEWAPNDNFIESFEPPFGAEVKNIGRIYEADG